MAVVSKLNNLVDLAREKSSERRRTLLREVTDLFFEETPSQGSATSRKFDEVLSSLAEQTAQDAREELSQRFSDAPEAPRGLVLQLAQDAIEVAAPMLARSSVLSDDDLLSIAETAGQGHLKAMSGREDVCERLSDTIVRRGDDATVARLIRNDGARLSRETFEPGAAENVAIGRKQGLAGHRRRLPRLAAELQRAQLAVKRGKAVEILEPRHVAGARHRDTLGPGEAVAKPVAAGGSERPGVMHRAALEPCLEPVGVLEAPRWKG